MLSLGTILIVPSLVPVESSIMLYPVSKILIPLRPLPVVYQTSEANHHLSVTFCKLATTLLSSSFSKLVSIIFPFFSIQATYDITDAAVNVDDGTKIVNHDLVIDLLEEIVVSLQVALKDLNEIIVAEPTLNGVGCTLAELASVVAGLLIVRIFYIHSLAFYSMSRSC